jgi:hypothetical protein
MALPITNIHSYLVHPGKGIAKPQAINGTNVGLSEKIVPLLEGIYLRSDTECETEIPFGTMPRESRRMSAAIFFLIT